MARVTSGSSAQEAAATQKEVRRRSTARTAKADAAKRDTVEVSSTALIDAVRAALADFDLESLIDRKVESVLVERVDAPEVSITEEGDEDGDRFTWAPGDVETDRLTGLEQKLDALVQFVGGIPTHRGVQAEALMCWVPGCENESTGLCAEHEAVLAAVESAPVPARQRQRTRTVQFEAAAAPRRARRPRPDRTPKEVEPGLVEHAGYSYTTPSGKVVHVAPHVQRLA